MLERPRITEAEWKVMKVLWAGSPRTANEVIGALDQETDWKSKTIRTLLNRLVKKEVISFSQDDKIYAFYPLLSEEECMKAETDSFIQRIYGGAFKPLLVNFIKNEQLSPKDIQELKNILDEQEGCERNR